MGQIPQFDNTTLGKIFNLNPVAMLLLEPDRTIMRANSAFCRLSGYDFQQLERRPLSEFPHISEVFATLPQAVDGHAFAPDSWREAAVRGVDGERRAVLSCLEQVWGESGRVTHLLWMLEDIEDRIRAERERKAQQDQLRFLTQRLITAQEEERRRVARELHDEWGQILSSMKMDLRLLDEAPDDALGDFSTRLESKLDLLLGNSRQLSRALRPSLLDDQGLAPALENLASDFGQDFDVDLQLSDIDVRFTEDIEITCFRLVQESLTNIRRHANAQEAKICINLLDNFLAITVTDDGQGFDPEEALREASDRGSAGLFGMMERVRAHDGVYSIFSRPGLGTRLSASLPIDKEKQLASGQASGRMGTEA